MIWEAAVLADEAVHWAYAGVLFVTGAVTGSLLNIIAHRMPREMRLFARSGGCPACGGRSRLRDSLPILGWLLSRGRCRLCRNPISPRYPLAELFTAVLWALEGWRLAGMRHGGWPGVTLGLLELIFVSAMVLTILVDIDCFIILDEVSVGGMAVALAAAFFLPAMHHAASPDEYQAYHPVLHRFLGDAAPWLRSAAAACSGMAAGLLLALSAYFPGKWAFKRQIEAAREEDPEIDSALGLGDVKLMGCFGAFLGAWPAFFIFLAGSILASAWGVTMKLAGGDPEGEAGLPGLRRRWSNGNSIFPFGPFLAVAALASLFAGETLRKLPSALFEP